MPKSASKNYNLQSINPLLAAQWHPTKNAPLAPKDFLPNSGKKVWWICNNGHEWKSVIYHRNNGSGCPYCSGQAVCKENSLRTKYPKLAKEWHINKNAPLTPQDVVPGSHKIVWWICKYEHSWKAMVKSRTTGSGCPHCRSQTSQIELKIYSELKCIFPKINHRKKLFGLECDLYIPNIKLGIEIDGLYWHKSRFKKDYQKNTTLNEKGISVIRIRENGLKLISKNDIVFSEKTDEFHTVKKLLKLISQQFHLSKSQHSEISKYINGGKIINDSEYVKLLYKLPVPLTEKSLWKYDRKLCKQWHPVKNGSLTPRQVTPNSHKKVWWICEFGHEWKSSISNRFKGRGCPYCSGKKVCPENCLSAGNPMLASEWHPTKNLPLTPDHVTKYSHKMVWWKCDKGHEYEAMVSDRSRGNKCPFCAGKLVCIDNCLQTKNPVLAREWHNKKNVNLTPKDVTAGTHKKVWWICEKGHEWKASIANRVAGNKCPYCSNKFACIDNCLKTINPSLAKEWHPNKNDKLTPFNVLPNSGKKVWWLCKKGHEWQALISHRNKGVGCPYCSGKLPTPERNLAILNPILALEWNHDKNGDLKPNYVLPNSHKKVWWICQKGHEWEAQIASRNRGGGCPECYNTKKE